MGYATFSREPEWFTIAPVGANKKLLDQLGWSVDDVDLFEVNEAFSVVPMAVMKDLGVPHEKMNIHGGAVAMGHPIGASGARVLVTLLGAMATDGNSTNIWLESQKAILEESAAHMRRMSRLPFLWQHAQRVKKSATPSDVVYKEDRLNLLHFRSEKPPKYDTPLVFVFARVNRPYILDLRPNKSVVSHFVNAGFDTYLIHWGSPTHADRHLTLESYINGYMRNVVDVVRERTGADRVNVLGYCMGGTMSSMFTALHPDLVKNQMPVGRHIVDLKQIICPVLNLMASKDDLVPCSQSEPFNDLVGSTDRKTMKLPAGHIGLAVGSRAQKELWPDVCNWLAERS